MNIYIDENIFISKEDIVAVLDSKSILKSKKGRLFIEGYEKKFLVHHIKKEVKSYVLVFNGDNIKLYESNISSNSIKNKVNLHGIGF